jgi:hypothetical protein
MIRTHWGDTESVNSKKLANQPKGAEGPMSLLTDSRIADALEARRKRLRYIEVYGEESLVADLQNEILDMRERLEARPLTSCQLRRRAEEYVAGLRQGLTGSVTVIGRDLSEIARANRGSDMINQARTKGDLPLTRRMGYAILEAPLRLGNETLGISDYPAGLTFTLGDQVRVLAMPEGDCLPDNLAEALCRSAYLQQRKHLFAGMDAKASFGMMQTLAAFSFIARQRGSQLRFDHLGEDRVARYS